MTTEGRSYYNAFKMWLKCLSVNSLNIMPQNKSVSGYHLGYLLGNSSIAEKLQADFKKLFELYDNKQIKIMVDSKHSFSKIGEAMHRMHSRLNVGKILLIPDSKFVDSEKK
jgi:NADPH:quinone reductase-like Zn-dependent oxidoreductase